MRNLALSPLVAASLSAFLLAACSSGGTSTPSHDGTASPVAGASATDAPPDGPITVQLREFRFELSSASAPAGEVTLDLENIGDLPHELVLIRTDLNAADLPHLAVELKVIEDGLDIVGRIRDLQAGQSATLTVNLPAGHYVFMCNVSGHYDGGMYLNFDAT